MLIVIAGMLSLPSARNGAQVSAISERVGGGFCNKRKESPRLGAEHEIF